MTPMESWALIALVFALVMAALIQGGRAIDWLLDRMFSGSYYPTGERELRPLDCPCATDRAYHARTARHLASEKHSTRSTA